MAQRALYFESKESADPGAPRILLITHHFPPDPAVGGVRWQEMARYLAEQGWGVDVVTRDFTGVDQLDPARLNRLTKGIRIFSVRVREPLVAHLGKIAWRYVRMVVPRQEGTKPDALSQNEVFGRQGPRALVRSYHARMEFVRGQLWASAAAKLSAAVVRGGNCRTIISSGPPHMAHEAARLASERTRLPFIVDMRDPWSLVQRLREEIASPIWVRRARRYEGRIIKGAAAVTMNTQAACDAMRAAYPEHEQKFEVVRNGSDDEPLPAPSHDGCFRIRFAGSIYMDRDPHPVFRAARRVITELGLTPDQFMIEFIGQANKFSNTSTTTIAEQEGVGDYVRVSGQLPRHRAMEFLAGAAMLLSLPQDSDYAVPAKIYEYVRFHAWMLVLATSASATAEVLRDSDADVVDPSDVDALADVLSARYQQYASGVRPEPVGRSGGFQRRLQADRLIALIQQTSARAVAR